MMDSGAAGGKAPGGGGPRFSAVLKDALGGVSEAGGSPMRRRVAMASGKANLIDVVTAVADTDVAMSTLVSVRDRSSKPTKTS